MPRNFPVIEFMIIVAIISIMAGIFIPIVMKNKNAATNASPKVELKVDENTFTVQKFTLDGHSYLFIDGNNRRGWDMEHDPSCPKCHPVTVKEMKVEGQ